MGVELAPEQYSSFTESEDVSLTDSELVYHVRSALKAAIEGDRDSYDQLVGVMRHDERLHPEEVALLVTCLKALNGAVSCIDVVNHRELLAAIFHMSLWNYSIDVMDALTELVTSLATSSGQYVDLCLDMLVSNFMPPSSFLELLKQPRGIAKKDQVLHRVHSTLNAIANLVPLSPLRLEKIIKDKMPNKFRKEPLITIFVENMLRLESGAIGELIGSTMLLAIVDSLIDLDVEISWDDILQDDFNKSIFEMELEDLEGPVDDLQEDGDESRKIWIQRFFGGDANAGKLDSLMVLTFEHLKSSKASSEHWPRVYRTLLQSFQKTVLTAYKSKFAQFVVFYACSLDPDNCGTRFAETLFNIFVSSAYPEWRMSAVAYLASYLSRAKFVSVALVATMLERLVSWCSDYCKTQDADINPKVHKVFYAGCQAIMYILCFRMRSMLSHNILQSFGTRIGGILNHPLSPLKVCLPSIVEEFLWLAKSNCLFDVPDNLVGIGMLESDLSIAFGGMERLDMFFPFDPCLLMKSDRFIRPNFVYWSMVRSAYDDDDNEVTSDEDEASWHDSKGMKILDDGTAKREYGKDSVLDEFDYSLDKMSITPKNLPTQPFGGESGGYLRMPSRIRPSTSPESL